MRVELHPDAETELYEAAAWYDDQHIGLGDDLLEEMTRCLDVISEESSMWATWPGAPELDPPIRRALASRFLYAIAYQVYSESVRVIARAHTSRRPFYWSRRARLKP